MVNSYLVTLFSYFNLFKYIIRLDSRTNLSYYKCLKAMASLLSKVISRCEFLE